MAGVIEQIFIFGQIRAPERGLWTQNGIFSGSHILNKRTLVWETVHHERLLFGIYDPLAALQKRYLGNVDFFIILDFSGVQSPNLDVFGHFRSFLSRKRPIF